MDRKEMLVTELCDEIDFWKEQATRYKEESEHYREQYLEVMQNSTEISMRFVGGIMGLLANDMIKLPEKTIEIS